MLNPHVQSQLQADCKPAHNHRTRNPEKTYHHKENQVTYFFLNPNFTLIWVTLNLTSKPKNFCWSLG